MPTLRQIVLGFPLALTMGLICACYLDLLVNVIIGWPVWPPVVALVPAFFAFAYAITSAPEEIFQ